jgi:nuclear transcription Y subunit beta
MSIHHDQDKHLPIANVSRIMKSSLIESNDVCRGNPEEIKISKEAKEQMQECVSEFIALVTCEAAEKCKNEKRKTINGKDLI